MKSIEKLCNSIIKAQDKRPNGEYKTAILRACEQSKKLKYKNSPYELMFLESYGAKIK